MLEGIIIRKVLIHSVYSLLHKMVINHKEISAGAAAGAFVGLDMVLTIRCAKRIVSHGYMCS